MKTFDFGDSVVELHDDRTVTRFSDGTSVTGTYAVSPDQIDTAMRYGLNPEQMNRDHDLLHTVLAVSLGLPWSDALHDVATGRETRDAGVEEAAVLHLQGYLNFAGISVQSVAITALRRLCDE